MAKSQTKKDDGDISTSKIYEVLQTGGFLEALWWDLISDLKEKPAYKQMKEMVEKLINKQVGIITSVPTNDAENLRRRAIITEICSMNYTVDTVFSKILYTRLQKKLPYVINEIVTEVKQKLKMSPVSESSSAGQNKETSSDNQEVLSPEIEQSRTSISLETNGDVKRKRGRPRKDVNFKDQNTEVLDKSQNSKTYGSSYIQRSATNEKLPKESDSSVENQSSKSDVSVNTKRKRGRPRKDQDSKDNDISDKNIERSDSSSKKDIPLKTYESPIKKIIPTNIKDSLEKKGTTVNNNQQNEEQDNSDAESDKFSFGNLSFTSVSSVHTSELSSYDDEISLSDGEGTEKKKKKRLSVNEVKQMLFKESVSDKVAMKMAASKRTSKRRKVNGSTKEINNTREEIKAEINKIINTEKEKPKAMVSDEENPADSKSVGSPQKSMPRRIRKPNSKYSSSNIICTLTNSQQKRGNSSVNGSQDSESESPKKNKKIRSEESNDITKDKTPHENGSDEGKSVQNSLKTLSKSQTSSDSFKLRPTVNNLTTRKSAPITLFSTATDKKS